MRMLWICWHMSMGTANLATKDVELQTMAETSKDLAGLIKDYRERCLWFLRPDYVPKTTEEIIKVLDLIERYGDREGFRRAEEIKACLSPHSKAVS